MKKKSKIRVLKDNQNKDSYTFVMDANSSTTRNSEVECTSKKAAEENTEVSDVSNLNKIYNKKKVLTNETVQRLLKV